MEWWCHEYWPKPPTIGHFHKLYGIVAVYPEGIILGHNVLHYQWTDYTFNEQTLIPLWCSNTFIHIYTIHYNDVIMGVMASQITNLTSVYSRVYSGADQRKHHSSASLAFVWGIHRGPVNSPHKWPVMRKMFPLGCPRPLLYVCYCVRSLRAGDDLSTVCEWLPL